MIIVLTEDILKLAMDKYTAWLDNQIDAYLKDIDHSVGQLEGWS